MQGCSKVYQRLTNFFQVCALNWHIFPACRLKRVFAYFLAKKWYPSEVCACCATINLSVQIFQKLLSVDVLVILEP